MPELYARNIRSLAAGMPVHGAGGIGGQPADAGACQAGAPRAFSWSAGPDAGTAAALGWSKREPARTHPRSASARKHHSHLAMQLKAMPC